MSEVRVIRFGDGRLNPLGGPTRINLHEELLEAEKDPHVKAVVLIGKGSNFSAGADISEFGKQVDAITLTDLIAYLDASFGKPLVAAIEGVALGGGLELALACHYRIGTPKCKVGLPEVNVGVIPGAGGTQRLPRVVGVQKAIELVCTGKQVKATEALKLKILDGITSPGESLEQAAITWAQWATLMPIERVMDRPLDENEVRAVCAAASKRFPPKELGGEGVRAALAAIAASARQPEGQETETDLFWETLASPQGAARRHTFFAVRYAQKSQLKPPTGHQLLKPKPSVHVGVVGAGLMGSGIALVLLQAGFTVHLVDIYEAALKKGVGFIHKTIAANVKKGRIREKHASLLVGHLKPSTSLSALANCQLVAEAVVERMDVKKKIFGQLDSIVKSPNAILLSNTSTLSIDEMAMEALNVSRRAYFAGWHFFSPAHIMKLVEIVVGKHTSDETTAILQSLTKRIGKIGVICGNCDGFIGNRMLNPYTSESALLLSDGVATVESVDGAIQNVHGFVMGCFQMGDLAGNDVGYFIRKARGLVRDPKTKVVGPNRGSMRYSELGDDLVTELGRLGQKSMKGWYDYDPKVGKGRKALPSEEVSAFIERYTPQKKPQMLTSNEIIERVVFPLVNEAFKILEEGISSNPSDIDVVYLYGYGWPAWRGGPMYWADNEVGLPYLLQKLEEFFTAFPGSKYYEPSNLLKECVAMNVTVKEYYKKGYHKKANRHSKL